jgi:hypothetical protein
VIDGGRLGGHTRAGKNEVGEKKQWFMTETFFLPLVFSSSRLSSSSSKWA